MAKKPSSKFSQVVSGKKPKPKPSQTPIFMGEEMNPAPGKTGKQGFIVGQPDPVTQKSNQTITDARRAALLKGIKRK